MNRHTINVDGGAVILTTEARGWLSYRVGCVVADGHMLARGYDRPVGVVTNVGGQMHAVPLWVDPEDGAACDDLVGALNHIARAVVERMHERGALLSRHVFDIDGGMVQIRAQERWRNSTIFEAFAEIVDGHRANSLKVGTIYKPTPPLVRWLAVGEHVRPGHTALTDTLDDAVRHLAREAAETMAAEGAQLTYAALRLRGGSE